MLAAILKCAPGMSIGIFDRTCRYTAVYGETSELRTIGCIVGELNTESGHRVYQAALNAIHCQITTMFDVSYKGKVFEVRVQPLIDEHFGIVGGVCWGIDITHRFSKS